MLNKNYICGIDCGNGYVKGLVRPNSKQNHVNDVITYQSVVGVKYGGEDSPVTEDELKDLMTNDFYNHMDLSFESPLVENKVRRLFGTTGLRSGYTTEEFDVFSNISKAENDLYGVLILGTIAGKALLEYYFEKKELAERTLVKKMEGCGGQCDF